MKIPQPICKPTPGHQCDTISIMALPGVKSTFRKADQKKSIGQRGTKIIPRPVKQSITTPAQKWSSQRRRVPAQSRMNRIGSTLTRGCKAASPNRMPAISSFCSRIKKSAAASRNATSAVSLPRTVTLTAGNQNRPKISIAAPSQRLICQDVARMQKKAKNPAAT